MHLYYALIETVKEIDIYPYMYLLYIFKYAPACGSRYEQMIQKFIPSAVKEAISSVVISPAV